jgi:hypothetical protein
VNELTRSCGALLMFRMLVLQKKLNNLSDEQVEYQVTACCSRAFW